MSWENMPLKTLVHFLALILNFATVKNEKIMIIKLSFLGNILFMNCLLPRLLSYFIRSASTPACERRCWVSTVQIKPVRRRGQELNNQDREELWSSKYLLDGVTQPKELTSSVEIRKSIGLKFTPWFPTKSEAFLRNLYAPYPMHLRKWDYFIWPAKQESPLLTDKHRETSRPKSSDYSLVSVLFWEIKSEFHLASIMPGGKWF